MRKGYDEFMIQIGNVPEINEVKKRLEILKQKGLITNWELPYENLLTRRSAAIFFLSPSSDEYLESIWNELGIVGNLQRKSNDNLLLSDCAYRFEYPDTEF